MNKELIIKALNYRRKPIFNYLKLVLRILKQLKLVVLNYRLEEFKKFSKLYVLLSTGDEYVFISNNSFKTLRIETVNEECLFKQGDKVRWGNLFGIVKDVNKKLKFPVLVVFENKLINAFTNDGYLTLDKNGTQLKRI